MKTFHALPDLKSLFTTFSNFKHGYIKKFYQQSSPGGSDGKCWADMAGLSIFLPQENKISRTFFIDCINKHSKVSNAHNSDDCHGVFNGGMLNKG